MYQRLLQTFARYAQEMTHTYVAFIPLHKICDCCTAALKHMERLFAWSFTEIAQTARIPQRWGAVIVASLTEGVVGNLYKTNWLMHQVCELHLALVQFQCWVWLNSWTSCWTQLGWQCSSRLSRAASLPPICHRCHCQKSFSTISLRCCSLSWTGWWMLGRNGSTSDQWPRSAAPTHDHVFFWSSGSFWSSWRDGFTSCFSANAHRHTLG